MIIRKLFKFEAAHLVRNCISEKCAKNIHGHSFKVETFFTSSGLDRGQMVVDFGVIKTIISDFINSFDHSYLIWQKESNVVKDNIKQITERWIELPYSPSAESLSILFFHVINNLVNKQKFNNREQNVKLFAIRIHETDTGYAEARESDLMMLPFIKMEDIMYSPAIIKDWTYDFNHYTIGINTPEQQIK